MATSFSGGRSLSTPREPLTMGKQHCCTVIGIEKKINWKKLNIRNIQNYKTRVNELIRKLSSRQ
jgi:hypothetical protein